ncbi:quinoprotein dehydrogenase-associated SoxYZ-like carrier [Marinobacter mobilis]|uniref:Sulfur-oxidizing protein SoxY n=1 Tax=Marinobacter mobilis TaxID=488533 RepID=A0A1H3ARY0_9GAMM|nr:quinoprotein dehydrogenase-associated SoxYZ-like carrier [Marinobacter mobilis]SDX32447.1 sulfur-oxidizing protein SoxY [Marinobacter mobilis]
MTRLTMTLLLLAWAPAWAGIPVDPYSSPMWQYNIERYLGNVTSVVLDEQIRVEVPPFAENSSQVPLTVDLKDFSGTAREIVAWVDLNPIPHLFSLTPGPTPTTLLSLNFRVQQATTVRVAVLTDEGVWHLGSAYVDAAGGGCTAPSMTIANPDWEKNFGTIRGGAFSRVEGVRYKFNVMHPMDSGMVSGVPVFHIENVIMRDSVSEEPLLTMTLSESAAENPMLVFELEQQAPDAVLWMRDNNGNEFERRLGGQL